MEQEDENISMLLNMGFADIRAIKRALKIGKGDLSEAVTLLTEQPLTSYSTLDDLRDVDMTDAAMMGMPAYDQVPGNTGDSIEFPTTNLYELETRVFTDSWSIPYKMDESLAKCLTAATRLADEGLCDADESCHRFVEKCLPECFHKLLSSGPVRRWNHEIHEGVYSMLSLLVDLVVARLKHGTTVPESLLKNTFSLVLNPECEWNQKNKHQPSEFTGEKVYADSVGHDEPFGWLVDVVNIFGNKDGLRLISQRVVTESADTGQMAALLTPLGQCARFLVSETVCEILKPAMQHALDHLKNVGEQELRSQNVTSCYDLLESIHMLCLALWPVDAKQITDLRLKLIIRMLKTHHFSARMNALKELQRLIEDSEKQRSNAIDADIVQEWMTDKCVLSLALEGNMDQVQYTDRMKELLEFMGPKLQEAELTRIWQMAEQASPHVVDNVHCIMAAAATRFNPHQFDHLLSLVRKSWEGGNYRLREKLLSFIGKIGQDSRLGRTAEKILDALWELARDPALPPRLVHLAMDEHLSSLNESAIRDQLRRTYIIRCIDDIRRSPAVYLPLKQLHYLARSITAKGGNLTHKSEKAVLADLNRNHDIIALITTSLSRCHVLSVTANSGQPPLATTLIDGKYTHDDYLRVHLDFLQFMLKEGDLYLLWNRCKDIWDTLVGDPNASIHDKETCFQWFTECINDLDASTQRSFFCDKVLRLDPAMVSRAALTCFSQYLQQVNLNDHRLVKVTGNDMVVDKLDLLGQDFIWQLILECQDELLLDDIMKMQLEVSYSCLSPRLKRDPPHLHAKFINECYKKLESSFLRVKESSVGTGVNTATKTLTAMAVSEGSGLPVNTNNNRACYMQHIHRILTLAELYISSVEEDHTAPRDVPPHAACFMGRPISLLVSGEGGKLEASLQCHSNECLGSVRWKVSSCFHVSLAQVQQVTFEGGCVAAGTDMDNRLLHNILGSDVSWAKMMVKFSTSGLAQLKEVDEPWDELPGAGIFDEMGATGFRGGRGTSSYNLEKEKQLPGLVICSQGRNVFSILFQLAQLEDTKIVDAVRRVLYLVPTDPSVMDKFDSICKSSSAVAGGGGEAGTNPTRVGVNSPLKKDRVRDLEGGQETLKGLLDSNAIGMTPFRLLYNLEVLSAKIMPVANRGNGMQSSNRFSEEFLSCRGLSLISALLMKDSLGTDIDYETRQSIYLICLQLLRYLLGSCIATGLPINTETEIVKRVGVDVPGQSCVLGPIVSPDVAKKIIQEMTTEEWLDMVMCLMRVAWAGAAGKLFLPSATVLFQRDSALSPTDCKSSRLNSTGSTHSSGSENEVFLQGGMCVQQTNIPPTDSIIACQALHLLMACFKLKGNLIVQIFAIVQVLLKARLPLWVTSTTARTTTLRFLTQCRQYFILRSQLLSNLTMGELDSLAISATQMLKDEIGWLSNFTVAAETGRGDRGVTTVRHSNDVLVAGHLNMVSALLTCQGVQKETYGATLIPLLLADYLFPASKLVLEPGTGNDSFSGRMPTPKCTGVESRTAAYELLVFLCKGCLANLKHVARELISLHHSKDPDLLKEFQLAPAVDGRGPSGYVGLKNGGATCYMNSVLQQLFLVQGVSEDLLAANTDNETEESLFYQLQSVFGHLLESQLQYFVPDKFWKCFRMDGQPVNVREQQDAFEFYTRLTEQIDEHLKQQKHETIFAQRFEGVYSIQRICQDCPHRYERNEPFLALNLTVTKYHDLQDSLEQFVRGELLEGDNAYYCEKCNQKRTALIRTCIKTLPPVLVIQLKRFGYDWEASRALKFDDYFQFPWQLDMGRYTAEGIAELEKHPGAGKGSDKISPVSGQKGKMGSPGGTGGTKGIGCALGGSTPTKLSRASSVPSHSPRGNIRIHRTSAMYELVGVVVHSGQANAGHYYSYIKDRRGDPISNRGDTSRWFKFNDTTVESVNLNECMLEQECFGGTYKAKVSYDSSNPMPEDRLRYWNGYMLFYDSIDNQLGTPKTPKTPRLGASPMPFRSVCSARKSLSLGGPAPSNEHRVRSSLSELSHLLMEGERQGMFRQNIPPRIMSAILHENLTFLRNRDVFSSLYFDLIHRLCTVNNETNSDDQNWASLCTESVTLGLNFLVNTYLRLKDKEEGGVKQWVDIVSSLVRCSETACCAAVAFFTSEQGGAGHLQPLLLECPSKMVRSHFGGLLSCIFEAEFRHHATVDGLNALVQYLLSMLAVEVPSAVKSSQQYFMLLENYCSQGVAQCAQIFELKGFTLLVRFLLGPPEVETKRWSPMHAQEFGPLHATIATLISVCDMTPFRTPEESDDLNGPIPVVNTSVVTTDDCVMDIDCGELKRAQWNNTKIPMPPDVAEVLYGTYCHQYLREAVAAYRQVVGTVENLTEILTAAAVENTTFTKELLTAVMNQYSIAPSNMLKELSQLIVDILNVSDSMQSYRITDVLQGFISAEMHKVLGLLALIENNKDCDSRRSYQCIKLVVTLAARSSLARDCLTSQPTQWQWSVEWLKERMEDHSSSASSHFAPPNTSNEDSNTKNFQRTTSAQLTLEEAKALLGDIEPLEVDEETVESEDGGKLSDIRESGSEHDNSPTAPVVADVESLD